MESHALSPLPLHLQYVNNGSLSVHEHLFPYSPWHFHSLARTPIRVIVHGVNLAAEGLYFACSLATGCIDNDAEGLIVAVCWWRQEARLAWEKERWAQWYAWAVGHKGV